MSIPTLPLMVSLMVIMGRVLTDGLIHGDVARDVHHPRCIGMGCHAGHKAVFGFFDRTTRKPNPGVMRVPRQAPTAATGRLVLELKTQRADECQHQSDKYLPIAERLKVGGFILKIDGDSAVFSSPFGALPRVSLRL